MPSASATTRSFGFGVLLAVCVFNTSSAFAISVRIGNEFQVLENNGLLSCPPSCRFAGETRFGDALLRVTGLVTETIVPGSSAKLVLTDFQAISGGTAVVDTSIVFRSSTFPPIGPPSQGTVHLDGLYRNRAQIVRDAHAVLTGFANATEIGLVDGSHIQNSPEVVSIPFAPPDVSKDLDIAITFLVGDLSLHLAPSDAVRLPNSATVSAVVPEPTTLLLWGSTMAGLGLAARWRRRRQN